MTTRTELTNTPEADDRFISSMLARHGTPRAAAAAACVLEKEGEHGRAWWAYIAIRLTRLHVHERRTRIR